MSLTTTNYRAEYTPLNDGIVVDLSDHANKLLAYEDISSDLSDTQENKLVDYVKSAMQMSYDRISGDILIGMKLTAPMTFTLGPMLHHSERKRLSLTPVQLQIRY